MVFDRSRPLVFMHIPKTSGMALTAALEEALPPRPKVMGFDRVLFGTFDGFDSFAPEVRRTIHDDPSSLPADAGLVHGHFALSTTEARYPNAQFLTLLREPGARLLSLWRYWQMQRPQTMRGWGRWIDVVERSQEPLERFLQDPVVACQTDNMVVRMLLWPHALIPDGDFIQLADDAILLERASERLRRFAHRDVVENDQLAKGIESWLGVPVTYRRVNETPPVAIRAEPLYRQLTDGCFERLEARTRLDCRLWEIVAAERSPGSDLKALRERALLRAVARHA